jgi:hypothetical protein
MPYQQVMAVAVNNRMMAKNSLRELSMSAVIAHREIFTGITSPSSAHLLENLREFCFQFIVRDQLVCIFCSRGREKRSGEESIEPLEPQQLFLSQRDYI